jgi:hypothetical protein
LIQGLSILFAIIVLGLSAFLTSEAEGFTPTFSALGIASGVITIVTLPVL